MFSLQRGYVLRHAHDGNQVKVAPVVQQTNVVQSDITSNSTSGISPETLAALERAGLHGAKVSKLTTSVQSRPPVILPNPLLQKKTSGQ